jgi:hypothetical protein
LISETEYLVDLLDSNWNTAIATLNTTLGNGTILDVHGVHPIIIDIRDMSSGRNTDSKGRSRGGNRINTASKKENVLDTNFSDSTCDISNGLQHVVHDLNSNIIVGLSVSGVGIPTGTTITSITNPTEFVMSKAATTTAQNRNLTFTESIYSKDIIVISESGQTIDYPSYAHDIRHETYNMSISIRTRQDDRILNDDTRVTPTGTFGVERIRSLYLLVRYILEQQKRGWNKTGTAIYENINMITVNDRTESNDKKNRIFGYKINVVMKRLAIPV